MTDLEILAQWHDEESLRRRRLGIDGELHTDAAATVRAAMAEIERLREELEKSQDAVFYHVRAALKQKDATHD